jgi:hypothetical protein
MKYSAPIKPLTPKLIDVPALKVPFATVLFVSLHFSEANPTNASAP